MTRGIINKCYTLDLGCITQGKYRHGWHMQLKSLISCPGHRMVEYY